MLYHDPSGCKACNLESFLDSVAVDNATDSAEVDPYPEGRYTVGSESRMVARSGATTVVWIFDHKTNERIDLTDRDELQWICDRLNESGADR